MRSFIFGVLLIFLSKASSICLENFCVSRNPYTISAPKKVINGRHHSMVLTPYNNIFITGAGDGHVYLYDLDGNLKDKFQFPKRHPTMIDFKNDELYVTDNDNTVYSARYCGGKLAPFRPFISGVKRPVAIGIPDDDFGNVYVGEWYTGKVHIYSCVLDKIKTITVPDKYPREILFDSDGNLNIPGYSSNIYVYSRDGNLVRTITHPGAKLIDGIADNCDGTRILADRSGKIIFADKNGKTIKEISGYGMKSPIDVLIAPDRTVWVTDAAANKIFLF